MRLFAFLVSVLATVTGCSNPKCWSNPSEASGCGFGDGWFETAHEPDREAMAENSKRQLAEYKPACDRGEPVACLMVGDAIRSLGGSAAESEAAYAVACRGGVHACNQAFSSADVGRTVPERARKYQEIGCLHGEGLSCIGLLAIVPPRPLSLEILVAACKDGQKEGCARAVKQLPDDDSPQRLELLARGCRLEDAAMCIALGRREAGP